ncbi:type IV pilus modification PilV family protein [Pontiella agarivorans]|uniref:Prepilin-type N-terminal cleavage/methylation domain-containing protein n=1 Tax=Pontiella agarivorans TaxID=3038953 RepID=A0ABU5MUT3_9BACT|nr:prepilin-type N-terminal cleavage/methylation domain-containing protein [Pontiella agarivorans]MDZ8117856.1 prepilin-type N-terminal cleavage/methylation domain-containing protein [Pontiella agarivorans]
MKHAHESKLGLTLVEVLLALVILSVGVSALMTAMSQCLSVVRTARNRDVARGLIQQIDMLYPIEEVDVAETIEEGDFEEMEGYTWFREIRFFDEEERPGLFLVTLRVTWSEKGRDAFEEITMFRYAPNAEVVTSQTN